MQANGPLQLDTREQYRRRMLELRGAFDAGASGAETIRARSQVLDDLVGELWRQELARTPALASGIALVALGGYGRRELFPCSDVDLLFLLDNRLVERDLKDPIRRVTQELWDCGIRVSPVTRKLAECERFSPDTAESTLALLDHRLLLGDAALYGRLARQSMPRLLERDGAAILSSLVELTRTRHARYGDTLFHLEPNIKDCPGGLRDVHVCAWAILLGHPPPPAPAAGDEFSQAVEFLDTLRCFLHLRHDRDDNILDWQAQDAAAAAAIGLPESADAAYWMRLYFRHARAVERRVLQVLDEAPPKPSALRRIRSLRPRRTETPQLRHGFRLEQGRLTLLPPTELADPAHDPDIVLSAFAAMAETGARLERTTEQRLAEALPLLSAHLEEGAVLWHPLRRILTGRFAGATLRAMHAVGILELLIPEFHGIDALVIRDAYHRYTVDEHTFVLIDTLHALASPPEPGSSPMAEWTIRLSGILRDLAHPELLFLGALLHDTGKGRSTGEHSRESARLARSVLARLELDAYDSGLVLSLIENHLEMSAALRRDIFDAETVRAFAGKVNTPEALRMLTLFTYADIQAVHPDALTPWKAENIWRLFIATANFLDRSVDEERVTGGPESELVHRVTALLPVQRAAVGAFLEGFPERYLRTRTPDQVALHYQMSTRLARDPVQIEFRYAPSVSEITLVTPDRPQLFATLAGVLAAWGMNIVTADAFSNRHGIVVDTFRFTDGFRTLELNASEHGRFLESVRDVVTDPAKLERLLAARRGRRRKPPLVQVAPSVDFDQEASSHSTLVQVVAQDSPGLLHALSLAIAAEGCNIEVALVDTEGETAIDVFYVTREDARLDPAAEHSLRSALLAAMRSR